MEVIEIGLGEDDGVPGCPSPGLHEVYGIPATQGRVTSEHHTGGLVHRTQTTMHVGEVLQTPTTDELQGKRG